MTAIFIIVYNTHRFLPKQLELLRKFVQDPAYDIFVIDNSPDKNGEISSGIAHHTNEQRALYVGLHLQAAQSSHSHANACNIVYEKYGRSYDSCLFLDHDIFPLRPFSIMGKLNDIAIAGIEQIRYYGTKKIQYPWPGLLFLNNILIDESHKPLINFSPTSKPGVALDTGGALYDLVKVYSPDKILWLDEKHVVNPEFTKNRYTFYALIDNEGWMHFINGSNWANQNDDAERVNSLFNALEQKLQNQTA